MGYGRVCSRLGNAGRLCEQRCGAPGGWLCRAPCARGICPAEHVPPSLRWSWLHSRELASVKGALSKQVHVCSCMLVQLGVLCFITSTHLLQHTDALEVATDSGWGGETQFLYWTLHETRRRKPTHDHAQGGATLGASGTQPPDSHSARVASAASAGGSCKARRGWQHACRGGFQGGLLQRSGHLPHHMAAPGGGHGVAVPASQTSLAAKDDKKSSSRTVTDTITGAVLAPRRLGRSRGELPAGTRV